jgi:hypothetical protein
MTILTDMDDLKRCIHEFPVELAPCPVCTPVVYIRSTALDPRGFDEDGTKNIRAIGWACPCGADGQHFEWCNKCGRSQP